MENRTRFPRMSNPYLASYSYISVRSSVQKIELLSYLTQLSWSIWAIPPRGWLATAKKKHWGQTAIVSGHLLP